MWDIKQKATNEQSKQTQTQTTRWLPEGKGGGGGVEEGKGGHIYGDGQRLDFG